MDEDGARPIEADQIDGARCPRETPRALGHEAARAAFDAAWSGGRPAHAWMLSGPRGIGKATLAYELSRRVLADGEDPDGPAAALTARQVATGAHPRLFELKRGINDKTKRARANVSVDDARRLGRFFALSAADGGWRVAIIDSVDELGREAANALLKAVEEPPARALFFLINHGERPLPATLISRCRRLSLTGLPVQTALRALAAARDGLSESEEEAAKRLLRLTAAAGTRRARQDAGDGADRGANQAADQGANQAANQAANQGADQAANQGADQAAAIGASPGAAARLLAVDGDAVYADVLALLAKLPRRDGAALERLSGGRTRSAERFAAVALLLPLALERLARAGALGAEAADLSPTEARLASRLAPDLAWARVWAAAAARTRALLAEQAELNLDPGRVLLDIAARLEEEADRPPPAALTALAGLV